MIEILGNFDMNGDWTLVHIINEWALFLIPVILFGFSFLISLMLILRMIKSMTR